MAKAVLPIDGRSFTLDHAAQVLSGAPVEARLGRNAERAILRARKLVEERLAGDSPFYGINTGFGYLASVRVKPDFLLKLQQNLILSHASGTGDPLPPNIARLALLLRANALARGNSGVRLELVRLLLALFNAGAAPIIPSQGSVGASGDLAPLAHLALLLIGRGEAEWKGKRRDGRSLLRSLGLEPLVLQPKEGLALINGTQISTAIAAAALVQARRLLDTSEVCVALSLEAQRGTLTAFDPRIHALRDHPGQVTVARNVRELLRGSRILPSHKDCKRVQDQYSLRCVPQVHGAARDALDYATSVVVREMNCVTDNPLIFPEDGEILSGGNFHAEPVAMAADFAAIAVAELASISERRIENMVNPFLSRLPPFLAPDAGLNSGFMMAQVTAAALVSENKTLAHPASVDSVPTSAGQEDHVSMSTWAARKLRQVVANTEAVLAIELLCAAQALDLQTPWLDPGRGALGAYRAIRERVAFMDVDREVAPDIDAMRAAIRDGEILAAAHRALRPAASRRRS